ncbi:NTP transferase domain-containing protein [Robbsia sp. KACC 23696]|uniref:phosphocholine cytidylyltransferase family protein n=1 Tax=Robbsia sp. KACC 23696 TaxID=3149231 RepID=UPI00325B7A5B
MRAIILAAGIGQRLGLAGIGSDKPATAVAGTLPDQSGTAHSAPVDTTPPPKCLLRFAPVSSDGGTPAPSMTLLERHLHLLHAVGITDITVVVGHEHQQIAAEIERLDWQPRPALVLNPQYTLGSVVSLAAAADQMIDAPYDVLVMDADVLYDGRMLDALVGDDARQAGESPRHADRLLIDRGFEPGDEPVKLCLREGRPVELRKKVAEGLVYDTVGESVGFFRFSPTRAAQLAALCRAYVADGRGSAPHEEAVRDLLLEHGEHFTAADATGLPWLEIDFPVDVARARDIILPLLQPVI